MWEIWVVAPTAYITTPIGNAQTLIDFKKKKKRWASRLKAFKNKNFKT
jgi:hypothetical protein